MTYKEFLTNKYIQAKHPLDDDMADGFESWLCDQDPLDLIEWTEEWNKDNMFKQIMTLNNNELKEKIEKIIENGLLVVGSDLIGDTIHLNYRTKPDADIAGDLATLYTEMVEGELKVIEKEIDAIHSELYEELRDVAYDSYSMDYRHGILRGYTLIGRMIKEYLSQERSKGK